MTGPYGPTRTLTISALTFDYPDYVPSPSSFIPSSLARLEAIDPLCFYFTRVSMLLYTYLRSRLCFQRLRVLGLLSLDFRAA